MNAARIAVMALALLGCSPDVDPFPTRLPIKIRADLSVPANHGYALLLPGAAGGYSALLYNELALCRDRRDNAADALALNSSAPSDCLPVLRRVTVTYDDGEPEVVEEDGSEPTGSLSCYSGRSNR